MTRYIGDWESLKAHKTPNWIMDGKFGIYTHWTPVTVATKDNYGDWYGYNMYLDDTNLRWTGEVVDYKPTKEYEYHCKRFGSPNDFGYKDMIKLFQPKQFDAKKWADLFFKAGAKFAGPVAMHHDNFAMWDSKVTKWNMMNNCGFDPLGELEKEIKDKGMKFLTTFHHSFTWYYFCNSYKFDGKDERYSDLYCTPHERCERPSKEFEQLWYDKLDEVMTKYTPDLLWFDFGFEMISDEKRKEFMNRYYNLGEEWQKDVGVCYKIKSNPPLPRETGILDFELGRSDKILKDFWITDTSIGPWFYMKKTRNGDGLKSANDIINVLVDIVSKNGALLLNVTPDDEGFIIPAIENTLLEIGKWLEKNGEAVYNTRPFCIFGEGTTILKASDGGFNEGNLKYNSNDVRYTISKDGHSLYATVMGWPGENESILLKALSKDYIENIDIKDVVLISNNKKLQYCLEDNGLEVTTDGIKEFDIFSIKIETNTDLRELSSEIQFIDKNIVE